MARENAAQLDREIAQALRRGPRAHSTQVAGWWRKAVPEEDRVCYDTKTKALKAFLDTNYDIVQNYGGADYAVSPSEFDWSRHLCEFLFNLEEFKKHYHRRSNVEATFDMIKAKFGASVTARLPVAQANEVLAKCVAHNLCCMVKAIFTAGLVPRFWPDAPAPTRTLVGSAP